MFGNDFMRCALGRVGLLLLLAVAGEAVASPDAASQVNMLCSTAVKDVEGRLNIPAQLLSAISLAESGRWDPMRGSNVSWPWTIYAEGHAHYAPDKQSAIARVRTLKARGVRNIDVGCMQINLYYHPDAFASLNEAFDPAANVAFAGALLRRLQNDHRSWSRAIAFYHSSTRKYALPYMIRVQRLWLIEHRRAVVELRDERLEVLRLKKAEREANQAGTSKTASF